MASPYRSHPLAGLFKNGFCFVLSLILVGNFTINGLPEASPHPIGLAVLTLALVVVSFGLFVKSYREFQEGSDEEDQ